MGSPPVDGAAARYAHLAVESPRTGPACRFRKTRSSHWREPAPTLPRQRLGSAATGRTRPRGARPRSSPLASEGDVDFPDSRGSAHHRRGAREPHGRRRAQGSRGSLHRRHRQGVRPDAGDRGRTVAAVPRHPVASRRASLGERKGIRSIFGSIPADQTEPDRRHRLHMHVHLAHSYHLCNLCFLC